MNKNKTMTITEKMIRLGFSLITVPKESFHKFADSTLSMTYIEEEDDHFDFFIDLHKILTAFKQTDNTYRFVFYF